MIVTELKPACKRGGNIVVIDPCLKASRIFVSSLEGLKKIVFFSCIPVMGGSNVGMGKVAFISML